LLDYSTILTKDEFTVDEEAKQYMADIAGEKIVIKFLNKVEQLSLPGVSTELDDIGFCRWLDKELKADDIKQEILLEFLRRIVKNLLARDDLDLAKLLRGKYILEKVLREKIVGYRKQAHKKGYQSCMFSLDAIVTVSPEEFSFSFDPNNYPANILYEGKFGFTKHYYSRIAMMNEEEVKYARAIDEISEVKYWVRNLDRDPKYAFWLPTATDRFYPDFVAKLNDERFLIVEYKGDHLKNEDTEEKELIGKVWAKKSGNLFLMAWKKDQKGRDLYSQIKKALQ
jgi:type III restriction enzyme